MAVIQPVGVDSQTNGGITYTWTSTTTGGDTGFPIDPRDFGNLTVGVQGTAAGTVQWQGSMDGGTTWINLTSLSGVQTVGTSTIAVITERPGLLRPLFSATIGVLATLSVSKQFY